MPVWVCAHIYYHASLDRLIDGMARPLVAELRARSLIERHFFVRYWQGGPHLRLRLLALDSGDEARVADALDAAGAAHLRAAPSTTPVAQHDYLQTAAALSALEAAGSVEPLEPDNSIQRRAYTPEYDRYGGSEEAMAAVEAQFAASSDVAFDVIAAGRGREHRTGQALAMLLAGGLIAAGDAGDRDAARRYFAATRSEWTRRPRAVDAVPREPVLDAKFERQRAQLLELAAQVRSRLDPVHADDPTPLARWIRSLRELRGRLCELESRGRLWPGRARGAATEPMPHQGPDDILRLCAHMHTNRLGLTLPEERYVRYLSWRIAEEQA
jgi:thiopeptide-type bacteriocin biosynthesis protein